MASSPSAGNASGNSENASGANSANGSSLLRSQLPTSTPSLDGFGWATASQPLSANAASYLSFGSAAAAAGYPASDFGG